MFADGHLSDEVKIQDQIVLVRWHLCSDLKLVCLACGLEGASSRRPCFLCLWDHANPELAQAMRITEGSSQLVEGAMKLLQPLQQKDNEPAKARNAVREFKAAIDGNKGKRWKQGSAAAASDVDKGESQQKGFGWHAHEQKLQALQDAKRRAKEERDAVVQTVQKDIPSHQLLLQLWHDASWLQNQRLSMPQYHLADCSDKLELRGLHSELHETWDFKQECHGFCRVQSDQLQALQKLVSSASEWQQQTESHQKQVPACSKAQEDWEEALQEADQVDTAWEMLVNQANQVHGVYVSAAPNKTPKIAKPRINPASLSLTLLKQLLSETCNGVQRQDMLQEHIPVGRR
jgi:hypothetical protein